MPMILPRPPQVGQAPSGELKLNRYSSGVRKLMPSSSKRLLKGFLAPFSASTAIRPSPREKASETEESRRVRVSSSGAPAMRTRSTSSQASSRLSGPCCRASSILSGFPPARRRL